MQRLAATAFTSLALSILVTGCGLDSHVAPEGGRSIERTAGPMLVDEPMLEWHPALPDGHPPLHRGQPALPEGHPPLLPEGHPPIPRGDCPAGGMGGFGVSPGTAEPGSETIST
jgi:hypothetical protein